MTAPATVAPATPATAAPATACPVCERAGCRSGLCNYVFLAARTTRGVGETMGESLDRVWATMQPPHAPRGRLA